MTADAVALLVEESVDERVARATTEIKAHIDLKFGQMHLATTQTIAQSIEAHIDAAFPTRELHKHREFHQGKIDAANTAKKVKDDLFLWAVKGAIGVALFLVGIGAVEWLKGAVR